MSAGSGLRPLSNSAKCISSNAVVFTGSGCNPDCTANTNRGKLWVKAGNPTSLIFTDNTGKNYVLSGKHSSASEHDVVIPPPPTSTAVLTTTSEGEVVWVEGNTSVADGSINPEHLSFEVMTGIADGSITSQMIADGSVLPKHLSGEVLLPTSVETIHIAPNAITTDKIALGAIAPSHIINDSITTEKIAEEAVTSTQLADGAVLASHITDGAVTSTTIAPSSITSSHIQPQSIQNTHLVSPENTVKGRVTEGSGDVEDLTPTQLTSLINVFSGTSPGLVPLGSEENSSQYLRGDGIWSDVSVGTVTSVSAVGGLEVVGGGSITTEGEIQMIDSGVTEGNYGDSLSIPSLHFNKKGVCTGAISNGIAIMQPASSSSVGQRGLVPQPLAGENGHYLRGDGKWIHPLSDIVMRSGGGVTVDGVHQVSLDGSIRDTSDTITSSPSGFSVEGGDGRIYLLEACFPGSPSTTISLTGDLVTEIGTQTFIGSEVINLMIVCGENGGDISFTIETTSEMSIGSGGFLRASVRRVI